MCFYVLYYEFKQYGNWLLVWKSRASVQQVSVAYSWKQAENPGLVACPVENV